MPEATLDQKIDLLEKLGELNDLLDKAQTVAKGFGGEAPVEDVFGEYALGNIVDTIKELSENIAKVAKPGDTTSIGIDVVQVFTRLVEAADKAKSSAGKEQVADFAAFVGDLGGAMKVVPLVVDGFSLNPIFGVYFFLLTESLKSLTYTIGWVEDYYETATGIWPDTFAPEYIDRLDDEAERAELKEQVHQTLLDQIYKFKVERSIDERVADRQRHDAVLAECLMVLRNNHGPEIPRTKDGFKALEEAADNAENRSTALYQRFMDLEGEPG
ncbi:MAG: hypothetical protein P8N02_17035 [Actinomycetota bacterium]|nr:hypothetical protein [Actinomycetota bacterium]